VFAVVDALTFVGVGIAVLVMFLAAQIECALPRARHPLARPSCSRRGPRTKRAWAEVRNLFGLSDLRRDGRI
jgi:hypothetical protein